MWVPIVLILILSVILHEIAHGLVAYWNGDPTAKNPRSTAAGLWQFLRSTWDKIATRRGGPTYNEGGPYDPVLATEYAYDLWSRSEWGPWNAAARC